VPHHLIDVCEPCEPFSVAEFVRQADLAASEIHGRGRRVLMVGGTALYLKGFMEGIFEGAGGDPGIRARLAEESARIGVQGLHDRLRVVDPVAAMRIHPNDLRRIVRALEVYETTGQPISAWQHQEGQERPQYEFRLFGLRMPRERLYERINARVRHMVDAGLVEETRELAERSPGVGQWASQALGYRDMMEHLRGECSLEDAIARIQKGTRRLAKRQICWFKRFRGVRWVDLDGTEDPVRLAVSLLPEFSH
jgi:tRNA dimethylallyltransferase